MKLNHSFKGLLRRGLILAGVLFSAQLLASSKGIGRHLKDATKLNRERAYHYAQLSNGKTLPLSYELIMMENLGLFFTRQLDQQSLPYLNSGIGLFEDDLIDMKLTPKFSPTFGETGPPIERITVPTKSIRNEWLELLQKNQHLEIYNKAVELLDHGVLKNTNQNCLTRHFTESIARSILNQEWHRERARHKGLDDPTPLLNSFLKIQIQSLTWAYSLDRRAFAIQQQNIPFFCQDVPAIPYQY